MGCYPVQNLPYLRYSDRPDPHSRQTLRELRQTCLADPAVPVAAAEDQPEQQVQRRQAAARLGREAEEQEREPRSQTDQHRQQLERAQPEEAVHMNPQQGQQQEAERIREQIPSEQYLWVRSILGISLGSCQAVRKRYAVKYCLSSKSVPSRQYTKNTYARVDCTQ